MSKDPRVRRLATEFACQWLHIYDFDSLDEKSERHFPTFGKLRGAMHEEAILYFTDLFQNDGSVLSVFDGDHTFLNEALAKHYGIPGVTGPRVAAGRRRQEVRPGRNSWPGGDAREAVGGLAHQPDPAGQLGGGSAAGREAAAPAQERPAAARRRGRDAGADGAPARRKAHQRPALRELPRRASTRSAMRSRRTTPSAAAAIATWATGRSTHRRELRDGTEFDGLDGLRHYLVTTRRDALIRQFCRKLLGYALGRGIQLSDLPLLEEMERTLKKNDYRFSAVLEAVDRAAASSGRFAAETTSGS